MTRFYKGTTVNADILPGAGYAGYVFINWFYQNNNFRRAVIELKKIEKRIKEEQLRGWFCSSDVDHTVMNGVILPKLGAVKYNEDARWIHFKKEVK